MKSRTRWRATGAVAALAVGLGVVAAGPAAADYTPLWSDWGNAEDLSGCITNASFMLASTGGASGNQSDVIPQGADHVVLALPASMSSFPGVLGSQAWTWSWTSWDSDAQRQTEVPGGTVTAAATPGGVSLTLPVTDEMRAQWADSQDVTFEARLGESSVSYLDWTQTAQGQWPFEDAVAISARVFVASGLTGSSATIGLVPVLPYQVCFAPADATWGESVSVSMGDGWYSQMPALGVTPTDIEEVRSEMSLKEYTYEGDPDGVEGCRADTAVDVSTTGEVTFTLPTAPLSGCSEDLSDYVVAFTAYDALTTAGFIGLTQASPPPTPDEEGQEEPQVTDLGGTINGTQNVTVPQGAVVSLAGHGFLPGEDVTATLHSTPILLGTFPASATGDVAFQARIPAGATAGQHTVVLEGMTSGRTVTLAVTVTTAGSNHLPSAANG